MTSHTIIRPAHEGDSALILQFVRELVEYENLLHEVVASERDIHASLFGPSPKAFALIAEVEGKSAGFALCFYNYSTFQGKPGIYIEDVFVRPEFRGAGIGKKFFQSLAAKAEAEGCGRIQWSVLNWNTPSIEFYETMGARALDEWIVYRLEGAGISDMARKNKKAA